MLTVEILRGTVAGGAPRKPGDRVEVHDYEARILMGVGRAKIVDPSIPVVLTEDPEIPQRQSKRRGRKPKTEGALAPSASISDSLIEELGSNAPTATE